MLVVNEKLVLPEDVLLNALGKDHVYVTLVPD